MIFFFLLIENLLHLEMSKVFLFVFYLIFIKFEKFEIFFKLLFFKNEIPIFKLSKIISQLLINSFDS